MNKYLDYKLCYVNNIDDCSTFELFFTDNFNDQWGDDWNDRPANCNADEPYEDETHHITSIIIRFTYYGELIFGGKNYSVEDMNRGRACWLIYNNLVFNGGDTLDDILYMIHKYDIDNNIQIFIREENINVNTK